MDQSQIGVKSGDMPRKRGRRNGSSFQAGDEKLFGLLSDNHLEILRQRGSMEEIAESLHVPVGTVKSRLNRARTALETLRKEQEQSLTSHRIGPE